MPNNIITKEWVDANDAAIQKKLQPLKDVKVVRVLSEAPQSWESLLTYTISNNTYSFKPGDEVRVPDNDATTGYTYYKLHKVENNTATWEALGESSASQMCSITVTITSDGNTEPEGMSFTVTDNQGNVFGSGLSGEAVMVPIGTNYIVSGSEVEGYQAESVQGTASETSVSVTLEYIKDIPNGVYAYYSDGSLRDLEHADSDAIGVAVVDDACSFVIGKVSGGVKLFGGCNKNLSGIGVPYDYQVLITNYTGSSNTTRIINACAGYTNSNITGAPAAEWCRTQFSGKGYLPSYGEGSTALKYYTEINAAMSAISGTAIEARGIWSSFIGRANNYGDSGIVDWALNGYLGAISRDSEFYARAFSALYIPVTFTLSSSDNTSISGRTVYVTDRTNEVLELTTDSNGQATGMVALGNVEIRVEGCRTLTKSVTLTAAMNRITVEICTPDPGIYAYYADGTMRDYDNADSTAIGVAVVTSNCSFVIDKTHNTSIVFGGYNKDLSSIGVVCTTRKSDVQADYLGESNTSKIIEACAGYTDSNNYATSAPAAEWCRTQFGGKGYLGSLGEWYTAYSNKSAVDSMMTKIGGIDIKTSGYHWTSVLYNSNVYSWTLPWNTGNMTNSYRNGTNPVRAFCAL